MAMDEINKFEKLLEDMGERILEYDDKIKEALTLTQKIIKTINDIKYQDVRAVVLSNVIDRLIYDTNLMPAIKTGLLEHVKISMLMDMLILDSLTHPIFNQYLQDKRDNV